MEPIKQSDRFGKPTAREIVHNEQMQEAASRGHNTHYHSRSRLPETMFPERLGLIEQIVRVLSRCREIYKIYSV